MTKRMDDMVPNERRTVRDIPIERVNRSEIKDTEARVVEPASDDGEVTDAENVVVEEVAEQSPVAHDAKLPPRPRGRGRQPHKPWGVWGFAAIVVLIIVGIAASVLFAGGTLTVTQRSNDFLIDGTYPVSQSDEIGALTYEVVEVTDSAKETVAATGEEFVETRASGQIIIYNNFSSDSQELVENTRFQTDDGLVYRIREGVVVPGMSGSGDSATPGSLEVTVTADEPGAEYNIDLTDFTIPGFEGDPRYFKFFARSKTPMSGGFSGVQKQVDAETEAATRAELKDELAASLRTLAEGKVPAGSFIVPDAYEVSYISETEPTDDDAMATLVERGTLRAVVVSSSELASFVATQSIGTYDGAPVAFEQSDAVSVTFADAFGSTSSSAVISGEGDIVWTFDEAVLKEDLAGVHLDDAKMVLSDYSAIDDASMNLRPIWKRSFPNDPDRIEIIYKSEDLTE